MNPVNVNTPPAPIKPYASTISSLQLKKQGYRAVCTARLSYSDKRFPGEHIGSYCHNSITDKTIVRPSDNALRGCSIIDKILATIESEA